MLKLLATMGMSEKDAKKFEVFCNEKEKDNQGWTHEITQAVASDIRSKGRRNKMTPTKVLKGGALSILGSLLVLKINGFVFSLEGLPPELKIMLMIFQVFCWFYLIISIFMTPVFYLGSLFPKEKKKVDNTGKRFDIRVGRYV